MRATALAILLLCCGCGKSVFEVPPPGPELHVAAAANLATIFDTLSAAEYKKTGVHLVPSFGSTATLTTQIENGAPCWIGQRLKRRLRGMCNRTVPHNA